jgi:site-specific recombinase XerD
MMSIDKEPLSPILVRFQQDLQLNRRGERTQQSYVRNVRKFAEFLQREPDSASEDDLRNYLLFIKNDRHWSASTINVAQQALKKFFTLTCPREWPTLKLVRSRGEFKIPVVITIGEVHTILKLIEKPSMLCFFTTVYSLGLRLQEALHLQVSDIDSKRMLVHVHRGKGAKDRMVPLPEPALHILRDYYKSHRNKNWIFPAEGRNHLLAPTAKEPMSESSVQGVIKAVLKQLNWDQRKISTHTLRHCYATHLLEAGVSIKLIQKYLGHAHLTTTMIYLHVTTVGEENAIAKINAVMKRKS